MDLLVTPKSRWRRPVGLGEGGRPRGRGLLGQGEECAGGGGRGDLKAWLAGLVAGEAFLGEGASDGIVGVDVHHGIGGDCCGPNCC